MSCTENYRSVRSLGARERSEDEEIVEVSLLLSGKLAALLEQAATEQGLTMAHLARHLIRRHCERGEDAETARG